MALSQLIESGSEAIVIQPEGIAARRAAAKNCLIAAGIYGVCCFLSVICFFAKKRDQRQARELESHLMSVN